MNNNLDMLQFLLDNQDNKKTLWIVDVVETAAKYGHLNIVRWIFDNFDAIQLRLQFKEYRPSFDNNLCDYAAFSGNLELVKFLREKHYSLRYQAYEQAALGGHIHILEWLKEQNYDKGCCSYMYAMRNGDIKILEWLKHNKHQFDTRSDLSIYAAEKSSSELLDWANNNGFKWNERTISQAIYSNNLDIVKWLRDKERPWNSETAAGTDNMKIMKWLRDNECPWNDETCVTAIRNNNNDILKWIVNNGCPISAHVCTIVAKEVI